MEGENRKKTKAQLFALALLAVVAFALPSIINEDLREDLHAMKEKVKEGLAKIWPDQTPQKAVQPKEPGMEAIFAIAGLLAVAYLVLYPKKWC